MIQGTVILTLTSFVVKVLSAVYRVPYQNLVGDEGFYVYQQIYPIYGIGMTLALTGLPLYLSKVLAGTKTAEEEQKQLGAFVLVTSLLAVVVFFFLFLLATPLAKMMGDIALSPLIKTVAWFFLLVPLLASFRGFYQGNLEMKPTAVSQLVEQGVRVLIILSAGYCFVTFDWSIYLTGNVAMLGALIGGIFALVILGYYQKQYPLRFSFKGLTKKDFLLTLRKLLTEGGTLCVFSAYLILFQLVDAFSVKQFLVYGGMTDSMAKVTKGVFDRGQPLAQLGLVVAVSMTAAFLPPLTKYYIENKRTAYEDMVASYIKVAAVISTAAALGLALVLPYINVTLFSDNQQELTLSLFVLSIFFVSMIQTFQTIYQSQNLVRYQLFGAVAGLFAKVIWTPVFTFYFQTIGTSLSTLFGLSVCMSVLWWYLGKTTQRKKIPQADIKKLLVSLCLMGGTLILYRLLLAQMEWQVLGRGMSLVFTLLGVMLGGAVYLISIIKSGLFTQEEWEMLPYGKKIAKRLF